MVGRLLSFREGFLEGAMLIYVSFRECIFCGSEKVPQFQGNLSWKDPFSTSMIVDGGVEVKTGKYNSF